MPQDVIIMPPEFTLTLLSWVPRLVVLVIGVLLLSGWLVASGKREMRRRVAKIANWRRDGSFATFVADFPREQAESEVLRAVYDNFQHVLASHMGVEAFVVRADDDLAAVYDAHLVDDYNDLNDVDLAGLIGDAAAACGRRLPAPDEVRVPVKLRTVRDVVALLEQCPRIPRAS